MTCAVSPSFSGLTVGSCWRSRVMSRSGSPACSESGPRPLRSSACTSTRCIAAAVWAAPCSPQLITEAKITGYERVRLDSPDFMTAAHSLYHASGFTDVVSYPESEIPDEYKPHWVFMERKLDMSRVTS